MPVRIEKIGSSSKNKEKNGDKLGVYLRIRPASPSSRTTLDKIDDQHVQTLPPDGSASQFYKFTYVFEKDASQSDIFKTVARPIVENFITTGKDGLIFTYGITGSGKTYTMEGKNSNPGLIYRTIDFIFNSVGGQQTKKNIIENDGSNGYLINPDSESIYPSLNRTTANIYSQAIPSVVKWKNRAKETAYISTDTTAYYTVFISLIEIYNRQIHDLFEEFDQYPSDTNDLKRRRQICTDNRTHHSYVANATQLEVKSADEAVEYYTRGIKRRKTNSTALNQESSRGHCVFTVRLVQVSKSYDGKFNENTLIKSQLCLVDLAGSERSKRSGATGEALNEGNNINKALGDLRQCIRDLRYGKPNVQYRNCNLTRLFKQYFEGHGSVRMVLCVKPTVEDFYENNVAMEFGVLTQDVTVDHAPPTKMFKRSKSRNDMAGYLYDQSAKKSSCPEFDDFGEFEKYWFAKIEEKRSFDRSIEALTLGKNEFRQNLLAQIEENSNLKEHYDTVEETIKKREQQMRKIESNKQDELKSLKGYVERLEANTHEYKKANHELSAKNKKLKEIIIQQSEAETILNEAIDILQREDRRTESLKKVGHLLKALQQRNTAAPSAPEMEPLQTSSPVDFPVSSLTESNTPPTTTNSFSDNIVYESEHHNHHLRTSPLKNHHIQLLTSPSTSGVPVINPRHNRSLSCSSMQWIHHKPQGTIDTGTVLKPKFKNGKSVRNLRSSDILSKNVAGYSVVHQDADSNGEVETSVYKGQIISTVCGGAQVVLNDVETMKQKSPQKKKRRAVSDAHFTP